MVRTIVTLGLLAALAACGSDAPPPPPAKTERTPTVFDDQLKAIDKAKAVEEQEMEHKRKLDEQLENGG